MATALRRLRLKRVSLVDQPANEQARVVLYKSAEDIAKAPLGIEHYAEKMQPTAAEVHVDGFANCKKCGTAVKKGMKECPKCGAPMPGMEPDEDDVTKAADGRPEEEQMDEKLKADLDAALAEVESLKKEREELQKRLDTPEEIEKRKLAALPESIRKQLQDQADEIRKMRDERAEAESIAKAAKEMPNVPGKPEDLGRLLKRVKDVAAAEDFEALTTLLKAASAQIEKGKLFSEVGKSGDAGDESPLAQFERKAQELVSKGAGKVAIDEAYAIVARQEPALYRAYSQAVTRGATPSDQE